MTKPWAGLTDRGQHGGRAIAILNISTMHDETEHQADGVSHDMPLAPVDPPAVG